MSSNTPSQLPLQPTPSQVPSQSMSQTRLKTSFFQSLWIIAQFELVRLFATRRGLLTLFTFAVVWYFILTNLVMTVAELLQQNASNKMSGMVLNSIGFGELINWPIPQFSAYWSISLYLFPIFSVLFAADQTASDRDRGSLRFLTMRCSRDSIFLGRFAGQMIIQCLLIIATLATTFVVAVYHNPESWTASVQCFLLITANLFLVLLPFTAMLALLSAAVRSPRQAIILSVLLWTIGRMTLTSVGERWPVLDFLTYLIPGTQLEILRELPPPDTLSLAYIPLIQTLVLLFIGRFVMARGSV